MKKTYHITFKEKEDDYFSKGENFVVEPAIVDPVQLAHFNFTRKYPSAIFISMVDIDAISALDKLRRDQDAKEIAMTKPLGQVTELPFRLF